jgi:hypothetical protein
VAVDVAETSATRGTVQGEVLVAAEQTPVQPGDLIRPTAHPLAPRR